MLCYHPFRLQQTNSFTEAATALSKEASWRKLTLKAPTGADLLTVYKNGLAGKYL